MADSPVLHRSYLFAPCDNEKLLAKVFAAGADAVVLDLEDAVAPVNKALARSRLQNVLTQLTVEQLVLAVPAIYVRINAITTPCWQADLAVAVHSQVAGIRLGKAESLSEIETADQAIHALEEQRGIAPGSLRIVPTIESASGLLNLPAMAQHPRVSCFSFGTADFLKDIEAENDEDERATLFARSQLVVVSRAAGLAPPTASVFTNLKDNEGLRRSTVAQRQLGFFGRSCIHPAQLPVIHEVFTPTPATLAEAQSIVTAFAQANAQGLGVATLANGQFIDAPIVERARRLLALAERLPASAKPAE